MSENLFDFGALNADFCEDLSISDVNALPPRAYYIPFGADANVSETEGGFYESREKSDEFLSLDGVWQFKKYDSIYEAGDFLNDEFCEKIPVPSCVQYYGYDTPQYSGAASTFTFEPPFVPKANPAFCYRRTVKVTKKVGRKQYIVFEGADSCLWLFVNKKFVGYVEISHADHEFEITDFLVSGENSIDVAVAKFCKGSYLELQDKWRFSGLFRSVYMLDRPAEHITDYKIYSVFEYEKGESCGFSGKIKKVKVVFDYIKGETKAEVSAFNKTISLFPGEKAEFIVENPRLWTAETPFTYPVTISGCGEKIYENFAVRDIRVENRTVYLNGKKVKFRGANRHDFSPKAGATVTTEQMLADIALLKKFNFNAVRTSHYPNLAEFYRMCERYGIYVISEADIECHGAVNIYGGYDEELFKLLSDNPDWQKAYLKRAKTMYQREKNRGCILFWSLGNESGYGCNHEACARYLREIDGGNRLIHYEGIQCRRDHKTEINEDVYYTYLLDVESRMYPSVSYMREKCLNDPRENRPLILCEYAHSMGNGPGGLEDYRALIDSDDRIAGAFVWEWADHGIDFGDGKYRYGKDFDVEFSDGNFCIDGVFGPAREIKSAGLAFKATNQPIKVEKIDGIAKFRIVNRYDFITPENLIFTADICKNGKKVKSVQTDISKIPPRGFTDIDLSSDLCEICSGSELCGDKDKNNDLINVLFTVVSKKTDGFIPADYVLCSDSFVIKDLLPEKLFEDMLCGEKRKTEEKSQAEIVLKTARKTVIKSKTALYEFDNFTGELVSVSFGGESLSLKLKPQILRATLDNDVRNFKKWKEAGLYAEKPAVSAAVFDGEKGELRISGAFKAQIYNPLVRYSLVYRFYGEKFSVELCGDIKNGTEYLPFLPRFGMVLSLSDSFDKYEYAGYGPRESYIDKHQHARKDFFTASVKGDYESYIKPQESSSHYKTSFVKLEKSDDGREKSGVCEIGVYANKDFSFSAVPYSVEELIAAAHNYDLPASDKTVLSLDYAMSGVGSESCGPALDEKYRFTETRPNITFLVCLKQAESKNL